jgi:hypothetical protein
MRVKHPISFFMLIVAMVVTAALAMTWSPAHIVVLAGDLGLLAALRWVAHGEGRKDAAK